MFTRLQEKWGVSTRQFWIIFIVFGLTGTTTAFLTRYITAWLGMDTSSFWLWRVLLRVGMLLFGYQCILLSYGALLGQWAFFWKYERKLLIKLGILKDRGAKTTQETPKSSSKHPKQAANSQKIRQIALFASGAGTNAEKIIEYLSNNQSIKVSLVVCNKPGAGVIGIAEQHGVPVLLIEKEAFFRGDSYVPALKAAKIDFIVLAGFLWKLPEALVAAYPDQIINIHPALLPAYGGKGMYGMKVHEAVIAAGEKESGITIHYVNERFDEGETIFQAKCSIEPGDTPEILAGKIHALEHRHFPKVVEQVLNGEL